MTGSSATQMPSRVTTRSRVLATVDNTDAALQSLLGI